MTPQAGRPSDLPPERHRPEVVELTPEAVEAVARRVAELLRDDVPAAGLVDAATVARALGVSRATVYERADDLGAVRLGEGTRARLRFDLAEVRERWISRSASERPDGERAQPERGTRRARRTRAGRTAELLPVGAAEAARRREEGERRGAE